MEERELVERQHLSQREPISERGIEPSPQSTYIRYKPPAQDCEPEKMVTIEPVYLGRKHASVLSNIRHMDPKIGVVVFYGVVTAVTFFLYWRACKNISMASLYTTSSVAMLALSLSAAFGIDFFSAVGAAFMPH